MSYTFSDDLFATVDRRVRSYNNYIYNIKFTANRQASAIGLVSRVLLNKL